MQSIHRALLLLKPIACNQTLRGGSAGTLRLESTQQGLSLSFKTKCLKRGNYRLFLFFENGTWYDAGQMDETGMTTTRHDLDLSDIAAAAVVYNGGLQPTFCMTSSGIDWDKAAARFRIAHFAADKHNRNEADTTTQVSSNAPAPPPEEEPPPPPPDEPACEKETPASADAYTAPPELGAIPETVASDITPPDNTDLCIEDNLETEELPPIRTDEDTDACSACPHVMQQASINPFPSVFPGSKWVKISYPGPSGWWHYISGTIYKGSEVTAKVLGVPGEYGMAPPIWLEGFGTYMRCTSEDARGYWLMFQDAETGEVLDQT